MKSSPHRILHPFLNRHLFLLPSAFVLTQTKHNLQRITNFSNTHTLHILHQQVKPYTTTCSRMAKQPIWTPVQRTEVPVLKLANSLTKTKNEFIPKEGRRVTWYNCGPTVYDASHMGHARTFLSVDIIRRILQDYFKYDVFFVQNVTDIDDKIILRARQQHLFNTFKASASDLNQELLNQVESAWTYYAKEKVSAITGEITLEGWATIKGRYDDKTVLAAALEKDEKFKMHLSALASSASAIATAKSKLGSSIAVPSDTTAALLNDSQYVLSVYLDSLHGAEVNDPAVFRDLPAFWEADYYRDMAALGILPPDVQTRVSEYVPEIITYVERIIANGYAYEGEGSVYFDTVKYDATGGHSYPKIKPSSKGNLELMEEGEGSLGAKLGGKRGPNDFALWKKSKPGEPSWQSPWGLGRPGWHIECSVMASAVLGDTIDVHSGGIDLAFPHHDNEIAQAEAYFDSHQWVNYFLHAGHLHIEGQKMSKSLKNFITIKEALAKYTARQLRLFFLMHQWDGNLDFKDQSTEEAIQVETTLNNFFVNIKAIGNEHRVSGSRANDVLQDGTLTHRYRDAEKEIMRILAVKQAGVHAALCDNINTPEAINHILELVSETNKYLSRGLRNVNVHVIEKVGRWVTEIMKVFGVIGQGPDIGFGASEQAGVNVEDAVMPYLSVFSNFRDQTRQLAIQNKYTDILTLCDRLRDEDLVELGVSLDDQSDGRALVKLVSKEELLRLRQAKIDKESEKAAKKAANLAAAEAKKKERLEKGKTKPEDMFKETGEYSAWDEEGIPTHDKEGVEVTKSKRKNLVKQLEAQKKLHSEYLAWVASGEI